MTQTQQQPTQPPATQPPATQQQKATNERLDTVAKTLAAATGAVTVLLAALGISSDTVSAAFNNAPHLILIAVIAAVVAILLSLLAFLVPPDRNVLEVILLSIGVLAYGVGLFFAVFSASDAANSAGRPSFSMLKIERTRQQAVLTLGLKADGVERDERIQLNIRSIKLENRRQGQEFRYVLVGPENPILTAHLRPNATGLVEYQIVTPFDPGNSTDIAIRAWSSADVEPYCEAQRAISPGCIFIRIPQRPADP